MTALFESGQVWFNEADKNSRHTKALVEQLLAFEPPRQTQMDGPDALEGGIFIIKNAVTDWAGALVLGKRVGNNKRV